jgi:hypothetical protein
MPCVAWLPFTFFDDIPKMVGKFPTPVTDCFMMKKNTAKGQLLLDISIAMVKTMIQPYRLTDDGYRKTVTF